MANGRTRDTDGCPTSLRAPRARVRWSVLAAAVLSIALGTIGHSVAGPSV